jgi:DNA-binding IclR family transcriptional regulator
LVNFSEKEIDSLFADGDLIALTERTITSKERLLEELDRIRTLGYALDDEECEKGVRCVAAPLKDYTGNVVAAVSVSGPVSRLVPERMECIKAQVLKTASQVSQRLGYEE